MVNHFVTTYKVISSYFKGIISPHVWPFCHNL
nr:MAG TPA_asm: hypothetical protein [Caudoviricetes sp.]